MKLNDLALKDKASFNKYLGLEPHELAVYSFEDIYIWKRLFKIRWGIFKGSLCVFFQDNSGVFLYLPPLSDRLNPVVLDEAFSVMDRLNSNKELSRIENIEERQIRFYRSLGYFCQEKFPDYLCLLRDMAELKGDKFKSKRACVNYFLKHYCFEYLPFKPKDKKDCLGLYNLWAEERRSKTGDPVYRGMLTDSLSALKVLLDDYRGLNCLGRVVKIGSQIKAFTLGFKLNPQTFCILYEVADLSVKGISQFIFRRYCADLKNYRYINIMDDSGLGNLRLAKLSYQPLKLIPSYIAKRNG